MFLLLRVQGQEEVNRGGFVRCHAASTGAPAVHTALSAEVSGCDFVLRCVYDDGTYYFVTLQLQGLDD
jgi:hypothetical protein